MKMILSRPLYRSLYCASTRTPLAMKGSRFFSTQPTGQHGSAIRYTHGELSDMTLAEWAEAFKQQTIDVADMDVDVISYQESAHRLREIVRSGILPHTDLQRRPERFFLAHRLLAEHAPRLGPGFWIRFTVHYNLCMGSVLGLGSEEQVAQLEGMQEKGDLGCFSLTEQLAGVNSGLVVLTTATYDPVSACFTLQTQTGGLKNWISQGLVADKTVVLADLVLHGKSYGPHAFLLALREDQDGPLVPGVTVGDMGHKTVGNDLDNAWIHFDQVQVPKNALLSRYADIEEGEEGVEYVQREKGLPVFHMIGQRLFTGRIAVAQAALAFREGIFRSTRQHAEQKQCWAPGGGTVSLASLPQLKHLFGPALEPVRRVGSFVRRCEERLCACLRAGESPPLELVEAIAVAKVRAVEESISLVHQLRNEVGSYALMAESGFGQADFLQCCKFAEGDSRILMQKMARDRMRVYEKQAGQKIGSRGEMGEEDRLCSELLQLMEEDVRAGRCASRQAAWELRWREVYLLAEAVMDRVMQGVLGEVQ